MWSASVYQISIQNLFFVRGCQTQFSYSPEHLSLFETRCTIAGGGVFLRWAAWNVQDCRAGISVQFRCEIFRHPGGAVACRCEESHAVEATGALLKDFCILQGNLRNSMAATGKGQLGNHGWPRLGLGSFPGQIGRRCCTATSCSNLMSTRRGRTIMSGMEKSSWTRWR